MKAERIIHTKGNTMTTAPTAMRAATFLPSPPERLPRDVGGVLRWFPAGGGWVGPAPPAVVAPHWSQNRLPGSSRAPHRAQTDPWGACPAGWAGPAWTAAPHRGQN